METVWKRLRLWLDSFPARGATERQQIAVFQVLMLGLMLTVGLAMLLNVLVFGAAALTFSGLWPNLTVLLCLGGALFILRRGRFHAAVWVVIIVILLGAAEELLTSGLSGNEAALVIFFIPITLAGLLIGRRSLALTGAMSAAIVAVSVVLEEIGAPWLLATPAPGQAGATLVVFSLALGLFGFLLSRFGITLQETLRERERAEAALRESEGNYRLLMEQAADGIFIADQEGRYRAVNSKACEMLAYSPDELLRLSLHDVMLEEDLAAAPLRLEDIPAGKTVLSERRLRRKDGAWFWAEINATRLTDGLWQSIVRDITERKRLEETLRASEAELRALFGAMQDPIFVLDATGRYLRVAPTNPARLYRALPEMVGKTVHDILPADIADAFLGYIQDVVATQQRRRVEYSLPVAGETLWFDATLVPLPEDAVFWLARDITERKQAEAALLEGQTRLKLLNGLAISIASGASPEQISSARCTGLAITSPPFA